MFVGEWSLATYPDAPFSDLTSFEELGTEMLAAMNEATAGWTYWTWRVSYDESGFNAWSLRALLRKGEIPFTPLSSSS